MITLDVRGLPPPEPFEQIMRALESLARDELLRVLIHREPYPLYDVLRDTDYRHRTTELSDGNYSIEIDYAP
jgi:TusA-related sulfurtransferase